MRALFFGDRFPRSIAIRRHHSATSAALVALPSVHGDLIVKMPLWVKVMLGLAFFTAMLAAATWLAGAMFFLLSKADPIAAKVNVNTWWSYWEHYRFDPVIAKRLKFSAFLGLLGGFGVPAVVAAFALQKTRLLHGEARFANGGEIHAAGLIGKPGIIIGKRGSKYLTFPGLQFVLLAAPTRSGKGVGIVVPNLLQWPESVVVLDVKQENFKLTSKYRAAHGQEVYLFNPFADDGVTHRQNPLAYISADPRKRVTEILGIGRSLYLARSVNCFGSRRARASRLRITSTDWFRLATIGRARRYSSTTLESSGPRSLRWSRKWVVWTPCSSPTCPVLRGCRRLKPATRRRPLYNSPRLCCRPWPMHLS